MNVGRPLKFNPDEATLQAMELFWRKGYDATSLSDLLLVTGLSKSSFYQAFTSKHDFFQRCISLYKTQLTASAQQSLNSAESGLSFIENTLYEIANETKGPNARIGCLLMNTANEFAHTDPAIAKLVSEGIKALINIYAEAVRLEQEQGNIPKEKDTNQVAQFLVSNLSGMKNMVKAGANASSIRSIADLTLSALH